MKDDCHRNIIYEGRLVLVLPAGSRAILVSALPSEVWEAEVEDCSS